MSEDPKDRFESVEELVDAINGGTQSIKNPLVGMSGLEGQISEAENAGLSMSTSEIVEMLIARRLGYSTHVSQAPALVAEGGEVARDIAYANGPGARIQSSRILVESSGECLADRIELVDSILRRVRNMIERRKLERGEALLLPSCPQVFTFFKDRPVDVVFCSAEGVVLDTASQLSPWSFSRRYPGAAFAVQLPSGQIGQSGVFTGDRLIFDYSVNNSVS
jgi:uncharacterized membrane protein (UPF0127 family)